MAAKPVGKAITLKEPRLVNPASASTIASKPNASAEAKSNAYGRTSVVPTS